MYSHCPRWLLLAFSVLLLATLPWSTGAFSLRRSWKAATAPMVQHIPVVTTIPSHYSVAPPQMTTSTIATNGVASTTTTTTTTTTNSWNALQSTLTKIGMLTFIAAMCVSLPLVLIWPYMLHKMSVLNTLQKEQVSLQLGHYCARTWMTLIPFLRVKIEGRPPIPEPTVWVCNHSSMLDVFVLLANDHLLRGPNRRPIKIVYWKQLEDNPITKLLFQQCGFIPVQMADNGHGQANDYDVRSFKTLLKETKRAFGEGFDVGILPEGQLNPTPELGLLDCYSGAFTLAKLAKRPIHMMAHYNIHNVWHPTRGMKPTSRQVKIRVYPEPRYFRTSDEFLATFRNVVGEYGTHGRDLPPKELQEWMDGSAWQTEKKRRKNNSRNPPASS